MATMSTLVLNTIFQEFLTEEINREASILALLTKRSERKATINWSVNVGGAAAQGLAISADAPAASFDTVVPASVPINTYSFQSSFLVNAKEVEEAASQVSAPELKNLVRALMGSAVEELMVSLNRAIYYGNGIAAHGGIYGLNQAVGGSDYAGISSTTYPIWKAIENFNTADKTAIGAPVALTSDIMLQTERQIREKGGRYTHIVTSPKVLERYKKLFAADRTITVETDNGRVALVDLGFGNASYAGRPILDDIHCGFNANPSVPGSAIDEGTMYFLNLNDINFYSVPTQGSSAMSGVFTQMESLAKTALYNTKYAVGCIPQLQVRSRKNSAVIRKIKVD